VYALVIDAFTMLVKAPRSYVLSVGAFPSCFGTATCGRINLRGFDFPKSVMGRKQEFEHKRGIDKYFKVKALLG
jgi:hypothetical protein